MMKNKDISIYIHIPFCEQKCNYCAFNSFCAGEDVKEKYIENLCKEIQKRKTTKNVKTIYIGGGTPSVLSCEQITKIVECVYKNYNVYENAEFTIEANPNSITENLLKTWKGLRINRLSIGVQSLNDKILKKIGRLHTKRIALEKIELARKYFDNVSVDLIVGLEGETGKSLCHYAKQLLRLKIKHISCYLLEVYENTKIFDMIKNGKFKPLNDGQTIKAFNKLSTYLQDIGMQRYEISNFAFNGYESQHNLNYWARGEYLGFGLSAYSFVDNKRIKNADTLSEYQNGKTEIEILNRKEEIEEIIMLGLRCCEGVDLKKLNKLNFDISKNPYYEEYLKSNILKKEGDRLFLNPIFYHLSNTIISNLFD